METVLLKEFEYYQNNKVALLKEHEGEYVVIKGEKVLAYYPSLELAVETTTKEHAMGTFFVQHIVEGDESVHRFHSRVAFGA
ncbi:MAG: hypothetical protein ACE5EN_04850 [Nitrospinota bacterium]